MKLLTDFVHLHSHTSRNSLLDSLVDVEELVEKAVEMNMPAVSTNGHGYMSDFVRLFKKTKEVGIKPIFGCEMYIVDNMYEKDKNETRYHLNLIAKNKKGLHNLFELVTLAHKEGFYNKPRIDFKRLKKNANGLICTSACLASKVSQYALDDEKDKAIEWCNKYQNIFGEDLYLEIMANKMDKQIKVNKKLVGLGKHLNIPLIATNDVHYLNKEDAEYHDMLLCIQTKAEIDDEDRLRFDGEEYYFKDKEEMIEGLFGGNHKSKAKETLNNTMEIVDKVDDIEIELGNTYFPNYDTPENYTEDEYLRQVCFEELEKLDDIDYEQYKERLEHELSIISNKNYSSYFLIVSDFMRWAKNNNIMCGVSRGSAGGCLVSYLLDIIEINPIEHDLLFSRFLNEGRDSLVDIWLHSILENRKGGVR